MTVALGPAIITASVALVASVLTAVITPAVTALRARRQAINDRFDAALAALLVVQAARHTPNSANAIPWFTAEDQQAVNQRLAEKGLHYFIDKTAEAKVAFAAVQAFVPEVRAQITSGWELTRLTNPHSAGQSRVVALPRSIRSACFASGRRYRSRSAIPRVERDASGTGGPHQASARMRHPTPPDQPIQAQSITADCTQPTDLRNMGSVQTARSRFEGSRLWPGPSAPALPLGEIVSVSRRCAWGK